MPTEDPGTQTLPRLLSVPGLMAVALFGISVIVVSRLFGPENILREIITELLASFGSTIPRSCWSPSSGFSSEQVYSACFAGHPAERPSRNPPNALESFKISTIEGESPKVPRLERSWIGSK